jgi:hypothetical protein
LNLTETICTRPIWTVQNHFGPIEEQGFRVLWTASFYNCCQLPFNKLPCLELSSTEFISMNKPPVQGPGLPFTISWHTMVQYDSESIFIIGGKQDGDNTPSNRTMIGKTVF